jgi:flagellar biosynthesis GTPase FlhF
MIMEKFNKDKLILPVVILLASFVLGGFYYASQVSKQKSIERQQLLKLEEERKTEEAKLTKEQQDKDEANKKIDEEKQKRQDCQENSQETARDLLKTKASLIGGEKYKEGAGKDLFLKDDFNTLYEACLSKNGLKK